MKILRTLPEVQNYIKSFESLRLSAYKCPAGIWTIGWGTTRYNGGDPIPPDMIIDVDTAQRFFDKDLSKAGRCINDSVNIPLTVHQFSSLSSFIYNVGCTKFKRSTLLKFLNNADYKKASNEFLRWNKAYDKKIEKYIVLRGLIIRRKKEMEIFLTPDEKNIKVGMFSKLKARTYMYVDNKINKNVSMNLISNK